MPISIDKQALYSIASLFKSRLYTKFLLVYMNCILYEDESSIDSISDGDFIIIIENIYYLDDSYFNSYKISEGNCKNVIKMNYIPIHNMIVPDNTKLSKIYKALLFHFGCDYNFHYRSHRLYERDPYIDNIEVIERSSIECIQKDFSRTYFPILGKIINLKTTFKDKNRTILFNCPDSFNVGILNSIKELVKYIEFLNYAKIKGFYLDEKQISFEEDKSFSSFGIKEGSSAIIFINK